MRIDVYSRHDAYLGTIAGASLISFEHSDELNGEDSVSIATTFRLREGYRLVWRDRNGACHEHVCQDPKGLHDASGTVYTDTALNSVCELFGDFIEDKRPYGYSFRRALEVCLEPTRWTVGTVDQGGTVSQSLTFYHTSAREALQSILECGGELETEIEVGTDGVASRKVSIRAHRGAASGHRRFAYGKDASSVAKTEHWGAITACYGYGKGEETDAGGYSRKLTFGDINGGLNYVADSTALQTYGRSDGKGGLAHIFGVYENGECEDASQLKQETMDYLDQHSVPGVTYEADVLDLVAFGRGWEGVAVGDDVQLVDSEFSPELRCEGRVTKLVTDLLGGTQTVTLGNVTETMADMWAQQKKELGSLTRRSDSWDMAASTPAAYLQQIIEGLNEQFNLAGMSYKFTSFEKGDTWSSVPLDENGNPTKTGGFAIQICSQGFRIASGTKADGSYNWRTFGTGEGFVADCITTGTLLASLIKTGVLLVGTESDPVLRADFDAKTVELKGSSVTIGTTNAEDAIAGLETGLDAARAVYGYCATASATAIKTVSVDGFKLSEGAVVTVRFQHANTAVSPRLNVSGTGAKYIRLDGSLLAERNWWGDFATITFVYDGGYWNVADAGIHALIKATGDAINLEVSGVKDDLSQTKSDISAMKDSIELEVSEMQEGIEAANAVFGVCSTSGSTQVKTVDIDGFKLREGATVSVRFTYANTASNPKLNVSGSGDKWIMLKSAYLPESSWWSAGDTVVFVYSGGLWRVADSGTYSRIRALADSISISVTNGQLGKTASIVISADGDKHTANVDLSDVRSAFANDPTSITITSGRVTFNTGTFVVNSTYFKVSSTGVITATSGTIGGFKITSYSIYNDRVTLDSKGITLKHDYNNELMGTIGVNNIQGSEATNGLVFDLERLGDYMCWAQRRDSTSIYDMVLTYWANAYQDHKRDSLAISASYLDVFCDSDWHNWGATRFWFDPNTGGASGGKTLTTVGGSSLGTVRLTSPSGSYWDVNVKNGVII